MVWTCNSCGKLGEREGIAEAGWCHRAGLATMKGIMQCCNCMLACGWDGYDEHGCRACIRTAGRRLPIGSARRAASEVALEKAFSSLPQQPKPNVPTFQNSLPALEHVKRIVVFEFDGVLFRTPKRPNWWPYNSYHGMIESLLPPAVPITPSDSWWNSDVVAQAKAAFEDPDTWSVLITFRGDAFKSRIHNLLRSQGISFNETRFRPLTPFLSQLGATYTGAAGYGSLVPNFKLHPRTEQEKHAMVVLGEILSRCSLAAALLELWACSNLNNNLAGSLSQVLRSTRAREVQIHGVDAPQHAAGTPTAAELAAMVQARALEKKLSRKGNVIPAGLLHGSSRTGARQRRHVLQSVREDAPEGSGAPARRVKARQVAVRTANWPVDVYAVRRKAAQWTFESSKKMDSRPFNFQLAVAWDEGEREEDSEEEEEEEEEGVWDEEGAEEEMSFSLAEEESAGWGWGGGVEFEWVDDADEVLSMTNSRSAATAWSGACDEVRSMCSASVVGASDVISDDDMMSKDDVMSTDSGWTEDDDWRRAAFEEEEETRAEQEHVSTEHAEGELPAQAASSSSSPSSSSSCAALAPYLKAVLQPGQPAERRPAVARTCVQGQRRPAPRRTSSSSGTEAARQEEQAEAGCVWERQFPCGGGWKKARNRREGRRRLRRMLATLADNAHVQAHLAPTGLTNCARARRSCCSVCERERWQYIEAAQRCKRTPVHLAPDVARL